MIPNTSPQQLGFIKALIPKSLRTRVREYAQAKQAQRKELVAAAELQQLADNGELLDHLEPSEREIWEQRIRDVVSDSSNASIPRHRNAGKLIGRHLIMHNGIRIDPLSYYNKPMLKLLIENRGVHEPEEERAFSLVLSRLPNSATMMELGSYWSFYSMWFCDRIADPKCFLIEPTRHGLESGKRNFAINRFRGDFTQAFIGAVTKTSDDSPNTVCVDDFMHERRIAGVDILHSDIQGYELEMLQGATRTLQEKRAAYVFISTHDQVLHSDCRGMLEQFGYSILRSTDLDQTTSYDGLIVACTPEHTDDKSFVEQMSF